MFKFFYLIVMALLTMNPLFAQKTIEVIQFHSTHRCYTCNTIETNTRTTLTKLFSKELKTKQVSFRLVDVDDSKNESLAERYEATGTALFLNIKSGKKEQHLDLTDWAFANARNLKKFETELQQKIKQQLK